MRLLNHRLAAFPVALVLAIAVGLAWLERGSIDDSDWLPYSFLLALTLAAVLLVGVAGSPSRPATIALAALIGLAAWNAVSLTWTPSPSLGRDEALLVLSGATAFALAATTMTARASRWGTALLLALFSSGTALAVAVVELASDAPANLYGDGRLEAPIGYTNALAAVFLLGFWPAITAAAERSLPSPVRAAALGGAGAMLAAELQAQSKGAAVGVVVGGALLLVLSPQRLRLLLPVLFVAPVVLLAWNRLTEPFRLQQAREAVYEASIRTSGGTLLLVAAVAAGVGLVYAGIDARVRVPARLGRAIAVTLLATVMLSAAAGVVWTATETDRIDRWASARWSDFTESAGQESSSNFGSLGSSRFDSWSVAASEFADSPIIGNGARSFRSAYLARGSTPDTPERSHSLELDVLSETGLVGFALLLAALVPPFVVLAVRGRKSLLEAGLLGAAVAWLAHASVDWIWTLPVLLLPFLALLGAGCSRDQRRPVVGRTSLAAATGVAIVAVGFFVPPWLSARFTQQALAEGQPDSRAHQWAMRLDPIAIEPLLAEAALARSPDRAVSVLRKAVRKEPDTAALHFFLGRELRNAGRREEALWEFERARQLYPDSPEILAALRDLGARR